MKFVRKEGKRKIQSEKKRAKKNKKMRGKAENALQGGECISEPHSKAHSDWPTTYVSHTQGQRPRRGMNGLPKVIQQPN